MESSHREDLIADFEGFGVEEEKAAFVCFYT
jgi:hypothetical protein